MKAIQNFMYELSLLPMRTLDKIIVILCTMLIVFSALICVIGYLYSVNQNQQKVIDLIDTYTERSTIDITPL